MASEKVHLPIHPPPTIYKDDPRAGLTQSEQPMYDEVLAHFTRTDPVYSLPNDEKGELMDQEKFWLSRECILRYLRASKWKTATAIHRLEHTLKWRREFGLYDIVNASHVEPEAVTGKEILFGYDVKGKPAFYMIPSRQNTDEASRQIQFAAWMLERSIDLMEPGVESIALLINFADRAKNPSISTARAVLNILQDHYPERLGLALIINVPFLVNAFFRLVLPFVDPVTREKVKFNPSVLKDGIFTPDMLMKEWWGGDRDFEYSHEKYWKDLVDLCDNRMKTWTKAWREQGAKVGISEWVYKKGSSSTNNDEWEDKKTEEVTVAEAPVEQTTFEPPKKPIEPESQPEMAATLLVTEEPRKQEHANPGTSAIAHGGTSTMAVSGAGAVAGDGGGGDSAAGGGDGGE